MERIQRKEHLLTDGIKRWKELIPKIIDEMFRSSKPPIKEVVNALKRKEVKDWEGNLFMLQALFSVICMFITFFFLQMITLVSRL
jgi:formate dehydrogenase maturation protein FdhE